MGAILDICWVLLSCHGGVVLFMSAGVGRIEWLLVFEDIAAYTHGYIHLQNLRVSKL